MKRMGHLHIFRNFIAVCAIIAGFISAAAWMVNRPETLSHALAVANLKNPWQLDIADLKWKPLQNELAIKGITAQHRTHNKHISAARVRLVYKPWGLLKGKLVIGELVLDDVRIILPTVQKSETAKRRKKINIARLVLLKNLELGSGIINRLELTLGEKSKISADKVLLSMTSSLLGENELDIRANDLLLTKKDTNIVSAGAAALGIKTRLERWDTNFPYLNAFSGRLNFTDTSVEGIATDKAEASVTFEDGSLDLKNLLITINGRALRGSLTADTASEHFKLVIDIKEPISIPHFGRPLKTIDTSGKLSGKVTLTGDGFIPSKSSGRGHADFAHLFDASPAVPISLTSDATWAGGIINFKEATARAGDAEFTAGGTIDIGKKKISIKATGNHFPIEHIFEKFTNLHLKKIFGPTDFEANFEGWGRNFTAKVTGTTYDGGWKPITAGRVKTELIATYNDLKIGWLVFDDERQSGWADLTIKYGPKTGDMPRSKWIDLLGELTSHPLENTLAAYSLTGTADGRISITGPHLNFKGSANAIIHDGSLYGIAFARASSTLGLARKQLLFKDMTLLISKTTSTEFAGQLVADLGSDGIHFHGTPSKGLEIDASYNYAGKRWGIRSISWNDPARPTQQIAASGGVKSGGPIDLLVKGPLDLGLIENISALVTEARGMADINLTLRGTTTDPKMYGAIKFNKNTLALRPLGITVNNVEGEAKLDGNRISFKDVSSDVEDGRFELTGGIEHRGFSLHSADFGLSFNGLRYRSDDNSLSLEMEGKIRMEGLFPTPLITGDINIIDGKYSKDFKLIEAVSGHETRPVSKKDALNFNPRLALHARNTGDMAIRNNVGDIWLNIAVDIKGTRDKPLVAGSIEAAYGKVHYLGLNFDITRGFIEFREKYAAPYLEVYAQKEVGVYNIDLIIHGGIDNLTLDLSATSPSGPLDKRDVISLILFGITDQERAANLEGPDDQFTKSIVTRSVSGVLERPVTKFTHLDVFRLEAADTKSGNVSRIYIGKQLSDRLSFNFATDVDTEDAIQTIIAEYLLTDNLLLKGARSTNGEYELSGALRFKLE